MSDTYVFYTRSVGSAGTLGGNFTAEAALVRTDASLPGVPRIGLFRAPMAPGAWGSLASAIRSLGRPRSSGEHPPGTPVVSYGIMAKGKAEVVHGQAEGDATDPERQVLSRLDALVDEVMKHPHQALEGGAEWERAVVAPDDDVVLRVRVKNPGLVPVPFAHPAAAGGGSRLSLGLRRAAPGGGPGGTHEVQLAPADLVTLGPDGKKLDGPPEEVVLLEPGKELRLRARSRLRLAPAEYRASLRLSLAAPPGAGETAVSGVIEVDLPVLAVVRQGGRGGNS